LFLLLTLWVGWPLWLAPATRLQQAADTPLNSYILAWVQYALSHQLWAVFDANIFWPNANPLAYGELMLTQAVLTLPVRLVSSAPAALHNVAVLEGFLFSALGAYALALFYFRSRMAAALAGVAYGFAAYRVQQAEHVQLIHGEFLPLMILALEWVVLGGPRRRRAARWLLGASALAQWLASWYWAVFTFWAFVPYALGRLWGRRRRGGGRRLASIILPLLLAALAVVPLTLPYLGLRARYIMLRPEGTMTSFAARPDGFLRPPPRNLIWGWAWRPDAVTGANMERTLFPGLLPTAALVAGLVVACRRRRVRGAADRRFPLRLWCVTTLLLLSFCFGPMLELTLPGGGRLALPTPYAALGRLIPQTDQVRVTARWMLPALLGIALLIGWAWRRWFEPGVSPFRRRAGMLVALLLVAEHLTWPMATIPVPDRPSPLDRWLERQPYPSPTLLLPANMPLLILQAAFHHQPLVNGTNGYFPPLHRARLRELERFPAADVLAALRAMHVRLVAIDPSVFPAPAGEDWGVTLARARADHPDALARIFRVDRWWVVELPPPPPGSAPILPAIGGVKAVPPAAALPNKPHNSFTFR
jgi:hypothetical protein